MGPSRKKRRAQAQVVHEAPEDQAVSHGGGEMEAFLGTKTSAMGDQNPWLLLLYRGIIINMPKDPEKKTIYRVLKGPGMSKGRGCSWGTLRIPFGKIGEP